VAAGALAPASVLPTLLVMTLGSVLLGVALARLTLFVSARIDDVATAVIFQFTGAFGVWILAERLHLSGILTTVVFAMTAARRASIVVPARIRIPSYAVWEVAVFVLNVLAFILVGFQLKSILARLDAPTLAEYGWVAAAVCVATILARIAWVSGAAAIGRWRHRGGADGAHAVGLSAGGAAVVGWCGMRGTVTLAAALALPTGGEGTAPFPYRDLILFTAFAVVLGTLVVQGVTLRPLLTRLRLHDDGSVEREVRLARVETLRAGLAVATASPGAETAALVRHRYEVQLRRAEAEHAGAAADGSGGEVAPPSSDVELVRAATGAERRRLEGLRADGTIGDAAFQRIEQELDMEELDLEQLLRAGPTER
jgi:CPA1 family monovalent cation:H+ antiporter